MKKISLILAISASFVVGTLVAGNLVFADPEDSQNSLLDGILQEVKALNLAIVPEDERSMRAFVFGTLVCPNSDEFGARLAIILDKTGTTGSSLSMSTTNQQFPVSLSGSAIIGQLDLSSFSLTVIVNDQTCFPVGQGRAVVATASGDCGISETVTFSTNAGASGTFTGRVACI